jgi:endonuclease/exonuclease/phosphatase family metal-dependent hydrolase
MKGMQSEIVIFLFFAYCLIFPAPLRAQPAQEMKAKSARLMFYNAENLFDILDDSLTADEEFLPRGMRYWTRRKLDQKLNNLYKTIVAVGAWQPPAIVGLCEIENRYVLQQLVENTPLQQLHYQIIHFDSPDMRGIDVGMLYHPSQFSPISQEAIRINFPHNHNKTTRDVLYAKGILLQTDTVHIFINHWPSRRGGQQASAPDRNFVAGLVRKKTDSLLVANPRANIIIMGDLNDGPEDESLLIHLGAKRNTEKYENGQLYNMMHTSATEGVAGTHKYQGQWHAFDQIIVSGALLQDGQALQIPDKQARIFEADFLLQEDITYMGKKPFRTYTGYHYQGGFSDHLPVYIDLNTTQSQLTQGKK